MLLKGNRLKNKKDFERIFKQGKGFKQDFLFLKIIENNLEKTRFGFIVSKKISKKAVTRNKIKRQLREIIRHKLKQGQVKKGIDGAFVALQGIDSKEFGEIKENAGKLLRKAKILTTDNLTI